MVVDGELCYCKKCGSLLNEQEGFASNKNKHICTKCGYKNKLPKFNKTRVCRKCGKEITEGKGAICNECKQIRKQKVKNGAVKFGKGAAIVITAAAAGVLALLVEEKNNKDDCETMLYSDADDELETEQEGVDSTMAKCEFCGSYFDPDEAESEFTSETYLLDYSNVRKCLCAQCAIQAINEDKIEGVYFETCEECGQTFDLIVEESRFANHFPRYNGTTLRDHWDDKILCADCAISEVEDEEEEDE